MMFLNASAPSSDSDIERLIDWGIANIKPILLVALGALLICAVIYVCFFKKINALLLKHREIIVYLVVGVATTLINFAVHFTLGYLTNMSSLIIVFISWIFAVIFAYITNKLWVFKSKSFKKDVLVHEIISFTAARLFSLGIEEIMFLIFVIWLGFGQGVIKIAAGVVVIILNYIFSKLFIFRKINKIAEGERPV